MEQIELTILGSGSALPTRERFHAAHLLEMRNKQFLIDCGEGAQIRLHQLKGKCTRLNHIFISHLHADHCLGLVGLISSLGMIGHTSDIEIHSAPELEGVFRSQIDFFCQDCNFKIIFNPFNPKKSEIIYEDRGLTVKTIPLKHRVPTCGFLFEEKPKEKHLIREMIEAFNIPVKELKAIKAGKDFITQDGVVIENNRLTKPAEKSRKFAYCSDTAYYEKIVPLIEHADCLYHEATFEEAEKARAKQTFHSTGMQAATIAKMANVNKLIIGHYSARYKSTEKILNEAKTIFAETFASFDGARFKF